MTPIDADYCPAGGIRTKLLLGACIINVSFNACRYSAPTLGSFEFAHVISVNFCRSPVALRLDVSDLASGRLVDFEGAVDFSPTGDGGFFSDGGPIQITPPQRTFDLSLQQLVFDAEGHPQSGARQITDTDDNFALATMSFTVTSATTASDGGNVRRGASSVVRAEPDQRGLRPGLAERSGRLVSTRCLERFLPRPFQVRLVAR